jgi:hypothetical protein
LLAIENRVPEGFPAHVAWCVIRCAAILMKSQLREVTAGKSSRTEMAAAMTTDGRLMLMQVRQSSEWTGTLATCRSSTTA